MPNDTDYQPDAGPEEPRSFSTFIAMLEDGKLNADLSEALRDLNAAMNDHVIAFGGKPKGKMVISIDFTLEKGVFDIVADFKVAEPKVKRDRSIAWSTPGNNFSPENPRQMQLFGRVRDVTGDREVRSV
ncbi:conserved protein of unknown function [Magnetospirillum sp. XM-1]|uniref:hypothetical protein n=1 Tax=Magnetospirillum sp. XM-1 TaxID=1663591 RepID=UPI00073DF166|nr:hypothetical protein [Magnetospirillum sp. XM-1]CUW39701.1 conserved protein of unknown function [Magnetospirillum sp. XM-1]